MIKRTALPFLKQYYKYRPNLMENALEAGVHFDLQYDLVDQESNIVVDGLISYTQKNGETFTAALEASSKDKKEEVTFKPQRTLLIWDGLAVGSILVNGLFVMLYLTKVIDIKVIGGTLIALASVFLTLVIALIFRWLFSVVYQYVDRYHYIYAVEQFKQYEASEQWIAIGEDVFEKPTDGTENMELAELKDQCVKSGFGLLEIRYDLVPVIIITPARNAVITKRKNLAFAPRTALTKQFTKNNYTQNIRKRWVELLRKSRIRELQFTKSYYGQIGILLLSSLMIGTVVWQELSESDIIKKPYSEYVEELNARTYDLWKPEEQKPVDEMDQRLVQPFEKVEDSYVNDPNDRPLFKLKQKARKQDRSKVDDFQPLPMVDTAAIEQKQVKPDGFFLTSDGVIIAKYDCERVLSSNQQQYIIQHSIHATQPEAMLLIDSLNQLNISANIFWTGCLSVERDSFVIIFDQFYTDASVAATDLINYRTQLNEANFLRRPLKLRGLIRDNE